MKVSTANSILKKVYEPKEFLDLLNFLTDRIDEKLGEDHDVVVKILFMNVYKVYIVEIGKRLSKGDNLKTIEKEITDNKMRIIHYNSLKDFYNTYREYIEAVSEYMKNE